MSWQKNTKEEELSIRIADELIYSTVMNELEQGFKRNGLWGIAIANSGGDNSKALSLYIQYRAQSLKDELAQSLNSEAVAEQTKIIKVVAELKRLKYSVDRKGKGIWSIYGPDGTNIRLRGVDALIEYATKICGDSLEI